VNERLHLCVCVCVCDRQGLQWPTGKNAALTSIKAQGLRR